MKRALDRLYQAPHWLLLLIISAGLRIVTLGSESMWFDEAFTSLVARPGTDFWKAVLGDDHPPLWSMIQWLNVRIFGPSEFAFRLPAMAFSVGCVLLIWRIALALKIERSTALLTGLLVAFLPASIYVGQDGRMYAALAFFILAALLCALEERGGLFILAGMGAVYTQNAGVFYVTALGIGMLISRPPRQSIRSLAALIAIGLAWLPWAGVALIQAERVKASFWMPPLTPVNVFWPLLLNTIGSRPPDLTQIPVYGFAFVATVIGLIISFRWLKSPQGRVVLATLLGGPLLLAIGSLILGKNVYVYKPLLASGLLLAICWAYGIEHLAAANRGAARIALSATLAICLISFYTNDRRENIPTWVAPVIDQWQPGDVIYYTNATPAVLFGHYLPDKPFFLTPYHGDIMSITDDCKIAFGFQDKRFADLKAAGYRRAWVLVMKNPFIEDYEKEALSEIAAGYPYQTVESHTDKISQDAIYLVQL